MLHALLTSEDALSANERKLMQVLGFRQEYRKSEKQTESRQGSSVHGQEKRRCIANVSERLQATGINLNQYSCGSLRSFYPENIFRCNHA